MAHPIDHWFQVISRAQPDLPVNASTIFSADTGSLSLDYISAALTRIFQLELVTPASCVKIAIARLPAGLALPLVTLGR